MTDEIDDVVDAVMTASRAMLSVVARSLAASEHTGGDTAGDVTLPQYRALVVLAQYGTRRPADLARALTVSASTATRMCDRLVTRGLVARTRTGDAVRPGRCVHRPGPPPVGRHSPGPDRDPIRLHRF